MVKPTAGPAFWSRVPPLTSGKRLWVAVVTTEVDGEVYASSRPLALICTRPLILVPSIGQSIVLDLSHRLSTKQSEGNQRLRVSCVQTRITNAGSIEALDVEQLQLATRWTRDMLALHVERVFTSHLGFQRYLLLPIMTERGKKCIDDGEHRVMIDWDEMRRIDRGVSWPVTIENHWRGGADSLRDEVLFDPCRPLSRLLVEQQGYVPRPPNLDPEARSSHASGQSSASSVWSLVVDSSAVFHAESGGSTHEPLTMDRLRGLGTLPHVSFLSTTVFRSTSLIPAISSAIDDTLLGLEVSNTLLDGIIAPEATLVAITMPAAAQWDIRHCYERQELLGDTVLHLLTAIGLRFTENTKSRQAVTNAKDKMRKLESNKNLCQLAREAGLQAYIRCEPLWEAVWGPSGRTIFEEKRTRDRKEFPMTARVSITRFKKAPRCSCRSTSRVMLSCIDMCGCSRSPHRSGVLTRTRIATSCIDGHGKSESPPPACQRDHSHR